MMDTGWRRELTGYLSVLRLTPTSIRRRGAICMLHEKEGQARVQPLWTRSRQVGEVLRG